MTKKLLNLMVSLGVATTMFAGSIMPAYAEIRMNSTIYDENVEITTEEETLQNDSQMIIQEDTIQDEFDDQDMGQEEQPTQDIDLIQEEDTEVNLTEENEELNTEESVAELNITDEENIADQVSGQDVSGAIKEAVEETRDVAFATDKEREALADKIEEIKENYEELPQEQKNVLTDSMDALENAEVAVQTMQDAVSEVEETGRVTIDENAENSWRYMNGQSFEEAFDVIDQEADVVEAVENGEDPSIINMLEDGTIKKSEGETLSTVDSKNADVILVSVDSSTAKAKGIDVSYHNGVINWANVKNTSVKYAILRCGYGSDKTSQDDKQWARNVSECERLGIPYGVYLYSYAQNLAQVDSEVSHTLRLLKGHKPQFPVYYDLEENSQSALGSATVCNFAERYCSKILANGYPTGIYANTSWWNNLLTRSSLVNNKKYGHWVAQYNTVCKYNGRVDMWQYSSNGSVSGISGRVDVNWWYLSKLQAEYPGTYSTGTTQTTTVDPSKLSVSVSTVTDGITYKVTTSGDVGSGSISYTVKSPSGKTKNYTASKSGNSYIANINVSDFKEAGTYTISAYYNSDSKTTLIKNVNFAISNPTAKSIKSSDVDGKNGTFKITLSNVSSQGGVKQVRFAVWSQSDQKDIHWYTASASGSTYSAVANIKNHKNNYGTYTVHAYIAGNNGIEKCFVTPLKVTIQKPAAEVPYAGTVKLASQNNNNGTFSISVSGVTCPGTLKEVKVYAWPVSDTNKKVWYNTAKSGNNYNATIDISKHAYTTGAYTVQAYVYSSNGNKQTSSINVNVSQSAGSIAITDTSSSKNTRRTAKMSFTKTQGMSIKYCVYNNSAKVKKWYTPSVSGSNYSAQFSITKDFQEKGKYTIEAYAIDKANGQHYLKKTTFNVSSFVSSSYTTKYKGINYAAVYDYNYYRNKYSDLRKAYGTDEIKYLQHFCEHGMKEGRQASTSFNVQNYKARYADLRKAFGNNLKKYYLHYINKGKKEGRNGK